MKYKLIAVDLDDSLLGSDLEISQENKRALFTATKRSADYCYRQDAGFSTSLH